MSAGERAIAKEMKRQEQEKMRQVKLANKMLIPVSKKTALTLEMTSFDPNGVFYLSENRWMKIFKMEGEINKLVSALKIDRTSILGIFQKTCAEGVLLGANELAKDARNKASNCIHHN